MPGSFKISGNLVKTQAAFSLEVLNGEVDALFNQAKAEMNRLKMRGYTTAQAKKEIINNILAGDGFARAWQNRFNRMISQIEKEAIAQPVNVYGSTGKKKFTWVLGAVKTHHCPDCLRLSTLPPKTINQWRAEGYGLPREGGTECNVGCQCMLAPAGVQEKAPAGGRKKNKSKDAVDLKISENEEYIVNNIAEKIIWGNFPKEMKLVYSSEIVQKYKDMIKGGLNKQEFYKLKELKFSSIDRTELGGAHQASRLLGGKGAKIKLELPKTKTLYDQYLEKTKIKMENDMHFSVCLTAGDVFAHEMGHNLHIHAYKKLPKLTAKEMFPRYYKSEADMERRLSEYSIRTYPWAPGEYFEFPSEAIAKYFRLGAKSLPVSVREFVEFLLKGE